MRKRMTRAGTILAIIAFAVAVAVSSYGAGPASAAPPVATMGAEISFDGCATVHNKISWENQKKVAKVALIWRKSIGAGWEEVKSETLELKGNKRTRVLDQLYTPSGGLESGVWMVTGDLLDRDDQLITAGSQAKYLSGCPAP